MKMMYDEILLTRKEMIVIEKYINLDYAPSWRDIEGYDRDILSGLDNEMLAACWLFPMNIRMRKV